MKTKLRSSVIWISTILLLTLMCFCIGLNFKDKNITASAETVTDRNTLYSLNIPDIFDKGMIGVYLYGNSDASVSESIKDGIYFNFSPSYLGVKLRAKTGNGRYYSYYVIKSVELTGNTNFKDTTEHENNTTNTSTIIYNLPTLSSGKYKLTINSHLVNRQAGTGNSDADYATTFTFNVDKDAPTISGASDSETGKYTNSSFTVKAQDTISGIKNLYLGSPNNNSFTPLADSSITISKGSANGLYRFYAEDNAGNISSMYYVNFDDTSPTLSCDGANFGSETDSGFTVTASDNIGASTLYYKKDNAAWTASGNSCEITDTAEEGTYYFYAVDDYGNKSEEYSVVLGVEISGEFIKSETDNSVYFTWKNDKWTAKLDGNNYVKNTWIKSEGEHSVKLSSTTKNVVYTCFIDHNYIEVYCEATCEETGVFRYECTQCGDIYTTYATEETGHYYVASTVAATCTSGGYTVYTCTRCGDSYLDNFTNPHGHNYRTDFQEATCTEFGETVFTCQVCGNEYSEKDGTYPTGHNYTNTVIIEPTCTSEGVRRTVCDDCGYTFDTVIVANGHSYFISDITSSKGITTRTYTCSICGHTYKQELGNQYEEVSNYVEYLFNQYSPYMWWVLLASAGVWSIVMGVFFAIAQKNEDKEKSKKMIINYIIGLVVIAVILVACPYLIRGIAALVT